MSRPIKIRAHHLLCLQGYQGYGYSREFEENLSAVLAYLRRSPIIEVVVENDVICAECPNAIGRYCKQDLTEKMNFRALDLKVLEKLKIPPGTIDRVDNLFSLVNQLFSRAEDVTELCGQCQWREKCLWFRSRIHRWLRVSSLNK